MQKTEVWHRKVSHQKPHARTTPIKKGEVWHQVSITGFAMHALLQQRQTYKTDATKKNYTYVFYSFILWKNCRIKKTEYNIDIAIRDP